MDILLINDILDKKEKKRFGSFIRSPFFNTEARFVKLYEIILSADKPLTRNILAEKMFGKGALPGDLRFRKLVSEFMMLFKRFLAENEFSSDELSRKFMTLEACKKKKLTKEFIKQADDIIEHIQNKTVKDELYYRNMADIYARKYSVEEINYKNFKNDLSFSLNDYTDKYFTAMKMFLFRRFQGLEFTFHTNLKNERSFYNDIQAYISVNKEHLMSNDPEIYLRYLEYILNEKGFDEDVYNDYLRVLDNTSRKHKINEGAHYSSLINLLSGFINDGKALYDKKVIELGELIESKGIYKEEGITYIDLKIITESAIGEQKYKWAIDFAERNKDLIRHKDRGSVFRLICGKLYFFNKNFSKAKQLLSGISINDYIHYTEGKLIECRMEFEKGNYLSVTDTLNTVKKFMRSHSEINKNFKSAYLQFTNYLLIIVKLKEKDIKDNSYELAQLEKNIITGNSQVYAQIWLLKKIEQIKKGRG